MDRLKVTGAFSKQWKIILFFFEKFHMAPISITGQEREASCSVSEQVNDQAGGQWTRTSCSSFWQ